MTEHDHVDPDSVEGNTPDSFEQQRADIERIKDYCQKLGEGISSAADLLVQMREQIAEIDIRLRKLEAGKDD